MKIYQLDDDYALSRKTAWSQAVKIALIFIGLVWFVFLVDLILPFVSLNHYGIYPRQIKGLPGIVSTIFLHGSFSHIISNTLPLLVTITALFGNYPKTAKRVLVYATLLTGFLVWSFARFANHIGASGLLYALLAYIFISGFIKKDVQSIGISLVIAFLYGSLIFGIIPDKQHVSWESHLFGLISGVFLAWLYRNHDTPVYKSYEDWDEE
ncbi:GlpG protein (membrane protein of glp regulon) [hydrothermal vent metagenome]|uniref:GlpG protein (Membrane protein of glp regulon) n=1 Tax=hydrothermal vent metagenome TaxID=652676 RepID=A0A3B0VBQ6_9ZZZZ